MYVQTKLAANKQFWMRRRRRKRKRSGKAVFCDYKKKFRVPYKKIVYECHIILKEHECL